MEKTILILVLLTILNNSFQSPVNSRFKVHNKAKNIFINNEGLNHFENNNNPTENLDLSWTHRQWTIPQTMGWKFWASSQEYRDLTTENYDISTENNFWTDDYFTENFGHESTESPIEKTSEGRYRIFTDKQISETSTIDYMHPCGPLIVEMDRNNYFLSDEKVFTIGCNAYFAKHFQSRCNDGSIFNVQFNLKINGKLVIEEYMKRISMSYNGFYCKFLVSQSILRSLSLNNQKHFSAVCEATISTFSGSATNQSYESLLNLNDDNWVLNTEEPTSGYDQFSTQYHTGDDYFTRTIDYNAMTTDSTDSCGSLIVNISKIEQTYGRNENTTISCGTNFQKQCNHNSFSYAKYELIIDGIDMQEKYITKYWIWFPEVRTEFVVKNSVLEDLSKKHHRLNAYCQVNITGKSGHKSNSSSLISLESNRDMFDTGSPLYGSCSYLQDCKANRNLTCDWDRKCRCIYDSYLEAYYVPYEKSNEWYCAKPAKHNEQCFHDDQCKQLNKGSVCTQTAIGKVCECDKMYYWNGFKCVSVESETTTSYHLFNYELHSSYSFAKVVGVSFAGILGGYLFIVLALHLYLRNKKKQTENHPNVNRPTHGKRFVPRLYITSKSEDKKKIIEQDKIAELKIVK